MLFELCFFDLVRHSDFVVPVSISGFELQPFVSADFEAELIGFGREVDERLFAAVDLSGACELAERAKVDPAGEPFGF